jgi:hypothetical protein
VPVDYRRFKRGERWMIYDISIEGISLVSNYRTQFNRIIQTGGYNRRIEETRNFPITKWVGSSPGRANHCKIASLACGG